MYKETPGQCRLLIWAIMWRRKYPPGKKTKQAGRACQAARSCGTPGERRVFAFCPVGAKNRHQRGDTHLARLMYHSDSAQVLITSLGGWEVSGASSDNATLTIFVFFVWPGHFGGVPSLQILKPGTEILKQDGQLTVSRVSFLASVLQFIQQRRDGMPNPRVWRVKLLCTFRADQGKTF